MYGQRSLTMTRPVQISIRGLASFRIPSQRLISLANFVNHEYTPDNVAQQRGYISWQFFFVPLILFPAASELFIVHLDFI